MNEVRLSTDPDAVAISSSVSEKRTAMTKRKAEGLSEPLASSLLQFSLRKSKKGATKDHDHSNARQLEDLLSTSASPIGQPDMIPPVESMSSQNVDYADDTEMPNLESSLAMEATDLAFLQSIGGTKDWFSGLEALDPNMLTNINFTGDLNVL